VCEKERNEEMKDMCLEEERKHVRMRRDRYIKRERDSEGGRGEREERVRERGRERKGGKDKRE